jgi:hypothetical protein
MTVNIPHNHPAIRDYYTSRHQLSAQNVSHDGRARIF